MAQVQPPMRLSNGQIQPGVILLREGTDTSQGKAQLISNINACNAVADAVRSTLGPRGMDKLMCNGAKVTISNDGATIMKLLDIAHPAAKVLAEISTSQDAEVGDGTTSVVLFAASILTHVKPFIEDGLHPTVIAKGVRKAAKLTLDKLNELSVEPSEMTQRERLTVLASTALNSKLIANYKDLFAPMVVDCVLAIANTEASRRVPSLDLSMVGVKKVAGGSVTDSFFVQGVAFKKTFSYAGFEQMPKLFEKDVKVLLLNVELELKAEKDNAEVRISDPNDYQSIVDAEWTIIYEKLQNCVDSGANVVLSRLPIGDLGTQYFADRGLFCAGRVAEDDLTRVSKATGGVVQTSILDLTRDGVLGVCDKFEEKQVGGERYNVFTGCPRAKTATIVLRGGSEQFIEESHRSIHDALMIAKRACFSADPDATVSSDDGDPTTDFASAATKKKMSSRIVGGGGAVEMALSKYLRDRALEVHGKDQLILAAFAKALEVIPRQLAINSGFDATDVLNALRQKHAQSSNLPAGPWYGVDCNQEGVVDTMASKIWEPAANKANSLAAAAEAAVLVMSIDETVNNPQSEQPGAADKSGVSLAQQQQRTSAALGGRGMQSLMGRGGGRGVRRLK